MWGMMLCRLWCVFHFRFENLYTKIFATTPHIISQHSPRLGAIFIFLILKCFQARRINWNFDLNWFTWLWGDDVVHIMVCVPFFIWKFVHQNICYHSPHNFTALFTSGRNIYFFNFKMLPSKTIKEFWAFLTFDLISFTWMWGDDVVCSIFDLKICTPKYLLPPPHNFTALPTTERNIYFFNSKMLPNKEDKWILSILELWFKLIYMTVRWWCCVDYGVCSIFDLKICTPKYWKP